MPLFLRQRQPELVEEMDRPDCPPLMLENTYRQFSTINLLLSQWKKIYRKDIRPYMKRNKSYTLLDIGFGGGDVSARLATWASNDGFDLQVTGIETDQRAFEFVQSLEMPANVRFRHCSSSDLIEEQASFDFVISNHVIHHLTDAALHTLLLEAQKLATCKVIFNDLERSDAAYALFYIFARYLFRRSFIVYDGLISIKRSFTYSELKGKTPDGWIVRRLFPFRLLLTYEHI